MKPRSVCAQDVLLKVTGGVGSCYFRRRETTTDVQDLFTGGLAAGKARWSAVGNTSDQHYGDRVGADRRADGGRVGQSVWLCVDTDGCCGIWVDFAGAVSLERISSMAPRG
jgi:hypothetical protein